MTIKHWREAVLLAVALLCSGRSSASYVHVDIRDLIIRADKILIGVIERESNIADANECVYLSNIVEISSQEEFVSQNIGVGTRVCGEENAVSGCPNCIIFSENILRTKSDIFSTRVVLFLSKLLHGYEPYSFSQGVFFVQPDGVITDTRGRQLIGIRTHCFQAENPSFTQWNYESSDNYCEPVTSIDLRHIEYLEQFIVSVLRGEDLW